MTLISEPKGSKVEMISKSEDREVWVLTRPESKSTFGDTLLWFFIRSGDYIYVLDYQCYTEGYAELESLFKQSAETIRIEAAPQEGETTTT
jgi:hypothetical protein